MEGHEEIAEVTKIISVKDTVAPKISPTAASSLPESAKIGEEIALPEFTVTDHNTLEGELAVKAIRPDGGEAAVNDGKFIVSAAGEWKIVASQKDAAGNRRQAIHGNLQPKTKRLQVMPKTLSRPTIPSVSRGSGTVISLSRRS